MKKVMILVLIASLISCADPENGHIYLDDKDQGRQVNGINGPLIYKIIIIDNCEYISSLLPYNDYAVLTHKGNCKNHKK